VEALEAAFVKRVWEFIAAGKYRGRYKAEGGRELYRFDEPEDERYPAMIEIFSRKPANIDLAEGQHIVPIKLDEDSVSLSAILLNDDYYELVRQQLSLVFANVPGTQAVRGTVESSRKIFDGVDVAAYGIFRIITTLEFLQHQFT
jgi:hypothetical protein